jgi:ParB-like nuclease domain
MKQLEIHPLAELFPEMGEMELRELAQDIKERGQLEPIVTYENKILDGRNRYLACKLAGVEPQSVDFSVVELHTDHTPEEYVFSMNMARRNLTPSQRATIAAKFVEKLRRKNKAVIFLTHSDVEPVAITEEGDKKDAFPSAAAILTPSPLPEIAATRSEAKEAAAAVGVSEDYVHKARKLQIEDPTAFEEVARGEKTITAATKAKTKAKPKPAKRRKFPAAKRPKLPEAPTFFCLSHTLGHLCAAWKRGDDYTPDSCTIERQPDGSLAIELDGTGWGFRVRRVL